MPRGVISEGSAQAYGNTMTERRKRYSRDQSGSVTIVPPEKLLERLPSARSRKAALDDIHRKLAVATILALEHGDGGRAGVQTAVKHLLDYFSSLGVPLAALKPLEMVLEAIVDAGRGVANPVFEPHRDSHPGKPPSSVARLEFDGFLAAITELCIMHHKQQGARPYLMPACAEAAHLINGSRSGERVSSAQLKKLRERVTSADPRSVERSIYDELLRSEIVKQFPLAAAKRYARHVGAPFPAKEESS